jgi:hypothetical protein
MVIIQGSKAHPLVLLWLRNLNMVDMSQSVFLCLISDGTMQPDDCITTREERQQGKLE